MAITVNLYYTGTNGSARKFAQEMIESGTVEQIKKEKGNLKYDYFVPLDDSETVMLIVSKVQLKKELLLPAVFMKK
ncbi:hypothetical protein [uncultured Eubacterium sp.]|uniref:hypothetical protein n=1 Tax=uncultured Eubacterium sp. TaxID=165185 RepID=UPI00345DAA58